MAADYDVIIVGSGFGGSVTACRLAAAGRRVLVLERGREWQPENYPRKPTDAWIWSDKNPQVFNGWIDFRPFGDMTVVQGAAVGGGSQIYANISVEAQPWVFDQGWPEDITFERLKPHYQTSGEMLNVQELPDNQLTERFKLMREAAQAEGFGDRFRKLPLAVTFSDNFNYQRDDPHHAKWSEAHSNAQGRQQGTCIHCGNCDIGCPVSAKNTLDLNYLAEAKRHGAEIRPLHLVRRIDAVDAGYRVDFDRINGESKGLQPGHVSATKVILAAGSLGSTELLLRCREQHRTLTRVSRRLGLGWSSNGDFLTPAIYTDRKVSPTRGPTISCAIDFLDGSQEGRRFFVEDGGFPDVMGNSIGELAQSGKRIGGLLGNLFGRMQKHARDSDPVDGLMPWFGQAIDASNGRLYLGRPWYRPFGSTELRLDWDIADSEATVQAMVDMHKRFSKATGGTPLEPFYWRWSKNLITPHPLGGCAMGDSPNQGVVDSNGEVFGHPGLYVADGAILPKAIGLNPSRTIAALAEHIAERMIAA